MTPVALISDVHGNLHALERVRQDIAGRRIERVICLGDVASYNADQDACMERVVRDGMEWIAGNHDLIAAGLLSPLSCSPAARFAAERARGALRPAWRERIRRLPLLIADEHLVAFHGSPRRVDEYLRAERDVRRASDVLRAAGVTRQVAFFGHTHRACVWSLRKDGMLRRRVGPVVALEDDEQHLVNAGTVGEPRTADHCATYVIYDPGARTVEFCRLAYAYREARLRSERGGWRRLDPGPCTRLLDHAARRASRVRSRLWPSPLDDASLAAIEERRRDLVGGARPRVPVAARSGWADEPLREGGTHAGGTGVA
jgi:predicted phosphodiesterase